MLWWLRAQLRHLYSVVRWNKTDFEIEEELLYHLEMRAKELIDDGMSPEDARRAAIRRFGNVSRVTENSREIRRGTTIDSMKEDLRYSARMLAKQPAFVIIVVLTIMIGIGSNTAIFSVVNSVLLKPLPYDHPSELVMVWADYKNMKLSRFPTSGTLMGELRNRSQLLQGVSGVWANSGTFTGGDKPEQVKLGSVTENFFSVLGVKPMLGRTFLPGDGDHWATLILSYGLWQRRFGGDPKIIGKSVRFDDGNCTIVGVMPANFLLVFPPDSNVPTDIEAWTALPDAVYRRKGIEYLRMLARLKSGVTIEQAQSEADSIAERVRGQDVYYDNAGLGLQVIALHKDVVKDVRPALFALFISAGIVLLISCFNVANLLLGRANTRRKEMAVRTALGASKSRIARQLLIESLAICSVGGLLGLIVGWIGLKLLMLALPESLTRASGINLDWAILSYVAGMTLLCGMLAGLAPMLDSRKVDLTVTLKEEGRSSSTRKQGRIRHLLIVSEIALGFVILIGAGLMVRTLVQLHRVGPGFNPNNTLTFQISFDAGYDEIPQRTNFVRRWEDRLATLPGVKSVGAVSHLPLDDYPNWYNWYQPEGVPEDQAKNLIADLRSASPGYFRAIGARLISGRDFDDHDNANGHEVAIVDDTIANQAWPGESAIGKKIYAQHYEDGRFIHRWTEVVGVVENIKSHTLLKTVRGQIYFPFDQSARWHLSYVLRGDRDLSSLVPAIRDELAKIDTNLAIAKVHSMDDYVSQAMALTNFIVVMASAFAGFALLLAAIGIYGVISYSVGQQAHEIGIRMTLGASPSDIVRMVIKEGLGLTVLGVTIGLTASFLLTGYLDGMLFGVKPFDPITFAAIATVIPVAALISCWRPARKAASGSAMDVLRQTL